MSMPEQHPGISMAAKQSHLRNCKSPVKESADHLVPQVMEMDILDPHRLIWK